MNFSDIASLRVKSQHIASADFTSVADVVSWMGAMQAQDYSGALWAIGLRTPNLTQSDIEKAIINKEIVRTWPMRGTLHFVAAKDVRWMVKLLAPRATAAATARRTGLGITEQTIVKSKAILIDALASGQEKTRTELLRMLDDNGIETANQRGIHLLHYFAELGLICFGPHAGKQPTFVLLDSWLPPVKELSRDEALQEITIRFFTSHGPATMKDFTGWSNMTVTDARRGLELAGDRLGHQIINGVDYLFDPHLDFSPSAQTAQLLPGFDEFMLGYKDRSPSLAVEHLMKIVPGGNGMFKPTIVINGHVVGLWKRTLRRNDITIELMPFNPLSTNENTLIDEAISKYSKFTELPIKRA